MKKISLVLLVLLTLLASGLLTAHPVLAACDTTLVNGTTPRQIDTAIGCIPTTADGLAKVILILGTRIAGAIAVLLIIIGGFRVAASGGDPEALEGGRDMITSAIIGLVFILLATVILGIIGIDVLGISFFSRSSSGTINTSNF